MSSFTNDDEFTDFASSDVPSVIIEEEVNNHLIPNNRDSSLSHADQRVENNGMSTVGDDGVSPFTGIEGVSQSLLNGHDDFEKFESTQVTLDEPPTQPVIESDIQLHDGTISETIKDEPATPTDRHDDFGFFASSENASLSTTIGQNTTQVTGDDLIGVFDAASEDTVISSGKEQGQQSLLEDGLFDQLVDENPTKEDFDEFGEFDQVNELSNEYAVPSLVEDDHSGSAIDHADDDLGDFNALAANEAGGSKIELAEPVLLDQVNFDKLSLLAAGTKTTIKNIAQEDDVHDFGDFGVVTGGLGEETVRDSAELALFNNDDFVEFGKTEETADRITIKLNSAQKGDSEWNNCAEESGVIEEKTDGDSMLDTDDAAEKQHSKEESNNRLTDSDVTRDGITEDSAVEATDLDQVDGDAFAVLAPMQNLQQEDEMDGFNNFDGARVDVLPDTGSDLAQPELTFKSISDSGDFGSSENATGLVTDSMQEDNGDEFGDFDTATGDASQESAGEPAAVALVNDSKASDDGAFLKLKNQSTKQGDNNDEFGDFDEKNGKVVDIPGDEQTETALMEDDAGLLPISQNTTQEDNGDEFGDFDEVIGDMPQDLGGEPAKPAFVDDDAGLLPTSRSTTQDEYGDEFRDFDVAIGDMPQQSSGEPAEQALVDDAEILSTTNQNARQANIGDKIGDSDGAHRGAEETTEDEQGAQEPLVDDEDDFGDFGGFENAELAAIGQSPMRDDDREIGDFDGARGDTAQSSGGQVQADDDDDDFGEFGSFDDAERITASSKIKQETDDEFDEFGDFGEANVSAEIEKVDGTRAEATDMALQTNQEVSQVGAFAERAQSTFQTLFGRFSRENDLPQERSEEPSADIVPISSLLVSL